jgi:hypothetical protein
MADSVGRVNGRGWRPLVCAEHAARWYGDVTLYIDETHDAALVEDEAR